MVELGTAVNCEEGHDWVEGTAVGSLYCRRCGNYDNRLVPIPTLTYSRNPFLEILEKLTARGLQDIREGRFHRW